jgi:diguanylate cyclase (GGDEF)-like protein
MNINLRNTDPCGRVGGDEFAFLIPGFSIEEAKIKIPGILERLNLAMRENNKNVTFSMGAVIYSETPKSIVAAIREADGLMYQAKAKGKNNVVLKASAG